VQRGKYPGFQTDSEALFVAAVSLARPALKWNQKNVPPEPRIGRAPDPSRWRQEGKLGGPE
jgi:hypothetical protein